jgi:antitoxin MazE
VLDWPATLGLAFLPGAGLPLAACYQRCYERRVTKRLQAIGNSAGIIIDKPILDLLGITPETELEVKTDGERLIITPVRDPAQRARRLAKVQSRVVRKHERTFRKLAK